MLTIAHFSGAPKSAWYTGISRRALHARPSTNPKTQHDVRIHTAAIFASSPGVANLGEKSSPGPLASVVLLLSIAVVTHGRAFTNVRGGVEVGHDGHQGAGSLNRLRRISSLRIAVHRPPERFEPAMITIPSRFSSDWRFHVDDTDAIPPHSPFGRPPHQANHFVAFRLQSPPHALPMKPEVPVTANLMVALWPLGGFSSGTARRSRACENQPRRPRLAGLMQPHFVLRYVSSTKRWRAFSSTRPELLGTSRSTSAPVAPA